MKEDDAWLKNLELFVEQLDGTFEEIAQNIWIVQVEDQSKKLKKLE